MTESLNDTFAPWDNPTEKPLITFRSVTKNYGTFTAVDQINLDIYRREFFALLGPSGCGKTTLMRTLGGFETISEGRITIDDQDMAGIPPNKRPVNMMFQSYALFPHLSLWDNIAFGLKRDKMEKAALEHRVEAMLRLTRLEKLATRKPHQISGGQKQRVALARALAKAPKLLLLDEPLGALDKKLRQETQLELIDIQETTGTTFVIVTHDQEEAMTVASRIAVMDQGKLVQVDTPDRLYEAPNSIYVADFIGDINLIEGYGQTDNTGGVKLSWAENQPDIHIKGAPLESPSKRFTFAIRPEKVIISKDKPSKATNAIKGKIHDIAYLGNISTYHVKLENGHIMRSQMANVRRLSRREFTWDDDVWLSWTDTAGLILNQQNGR